MPAPPELRDPAPPRLGGARTIALAPLEAEGVETIARALPDPESLPVGTLVVILPVVAEPPSLANRLLAAFGRARGVSRALRCTAMVARGYVRVGAAVDPDSRADLVWGYAPPPDGDAGDATEPS
ncbi:MAG: hypothetical protein KF819_16810 [Labilithrix sp.]|nr:hypothetical protein [Labilithrix sp.]